MKAILQSLSLLTLFLIFSINSFSSITQQSKTGILVGEVVDTQSRPIEFASVTLEGTTIGAYTDEIGKFELKDVPAGNHTLIVSGVGIKLTRITVKVVSGQTTTIPTIEMDNATQLKEVAVNGKTEARIQQEQAYAIGVLDAKQLYNTTASMSKILNNISSVRVREAGGMGSDYTFSLNGFSGNQVRFFLDGIPMDNFGPSFNLSSISISMADRIEVYKGVLPVHLGADALGGAVNIVTRKSANYLDASYSIGSFNTHKVALNGAFTNEKTGFTVRVNSFYNYSDNSYKVYAPIKDLKANKIIGDAWVKRFHDNYRSGGIRLETGLVNKPYADYLLAGLIWSESKNDVQTGATMEAVYGGVKGKSQSLIPSIRYRKDNLFVDGLNATFYGSYSTVNTFNVDTLARTYNWLGEWVTKPTHGEFMNTDAELKDRQWLANANLSYMIDNNQSITLNNAFSSTDRKIHDNVDPDNEENKTPKNLTKNITGLGWLAKYDQWNVNVFGKVYDLHSTSHKIYDRFTDKERLEELSVNNTNFGYGAAISYFILPHLQTKASFEHAYRLPESHEIFGDGLIQKPNLELKPERSNNANLGVMFEQQIAAHTFYLEANGIYRDAKDFIRKGVNLTSNPTTGYENLGKVRTTGVDGNVRYQWKNLIHASANITYQNIIDKQEYEQSTGFTGSSIIEHLTYDERVPNIPYLFGHGSAGVQLPNIGLRNSQLSFDYSIDWVKKYYLSFVGLGSVNTKKSIPTQVSHDVSLGYAMEKGKYNVIFECTDIFDRKLFDHYKLQKPGRAFSLKFRYFINWL